MASRCPAKNYLKLRKLFVKQAHCHTTSIPDRATDVLALCRHAEVKCAEVAAELSRREEVLMKQNQSGVDVQGLSLERTTHRRRLAQIEAELTEVDSAVLAAERVVVDEKEQVGGKMLLNLPWYCSWIRGCVSRLRPRMRSIFFVIRVRSGFKLGFRG